MLSLLSDAKQASKDFIESWNWPKRPQIINFEITAACDARCIHCPRLDMDRPMKRMSMEVFERMVDQASDLGVPCLCPNGYGEICTIPFDVLEEYFKYISVRHNRFKILINTNGNRMDEERSALFIKHDVHLINITIDGATAATAEAIRKNLSFDRIESNIHNLLAMRKAEGKKYPKVRVGMISMPQTNPEVGQFLKRWDGIADFVGIGGFSSRIGTVWESVGTPEVFELGAVSSPKKKASACVLPFRDLNIWADGKAVLCCEDWNEEFVVGDLNTQTLDEIWHGPKITEVRRQHMAKTGHNVSLCAKCNNWIQPTVGARLWS